LHVTPGRDPPPNDVTAQTNYDKLRQTARAEIAQRLRRVCVDWPETDFQELVDDATTIALRYPSPWWELEKEKTYGH
jgi:predicted nucleic acid-binding OB-fold protein